MFTFEKLESFFPKPTLVVKIHVWVKGAMGE